MKNFFLLLILALTFVSCGGSSASSVNTNYANTFTAEELDKIEEAYLTAHENYSTQYLFLTLVVGSEKMTFITTQSTGHLNYDASYENTVYLIKQNSKFIVTKNSVSTTYDTVDRALENCF